MLFVALLVLFAALLAANALLRRGHRGAGVMNGTRDSYGMHLMALGGSMQQYRAHPRHGFDMAKYTNDFGGA